MPVPSTTTPVSGVVVRVLPDVAAIDRAFDYVVPEADRHQVTVGTMVSVPLHGRRVEGWVVEVDVDPPAGVTVLPIRRILGHGPAPDVLDLGRWAARRWVGRTATFFGAASPPRRVPGLPPARPSRPWRCDDPAVTRWLDLFDQPRTLLRLPPAEDPTTVAIAAASRGDALVLCPEHSMATTMLRRLRAAGVAAVRAPDDWAAAAAGGVSVVGTQVAAFATMANLAAVVVVDESNEAYQHGESPTWHAREVALERARRARIPIVLTSATPSLEAQQRTPVVTLSRAEERAGWPVVEVVDRRDDDWGRTGLYSQRLVAALRTDGVVACVLNRSGRAALLGCRTCGELTRCDRCDGAMHQPEPGVLVCRRCDETRPVVCQKCGAARLAILRQGVARAREELEALLGEPVVELSASTRGRDVPSARAYVGTEAVLHQLDHASVVAFLEFDQELLAPRYRAAEQALQLLANAGRLCGGRRGLVVVQTRHPDHEVLRAAVSADPGLVLEREAQRRRIMGFPPAATVAAVGGDAAPEFLARLGTPAGIEVLERDGSWLVRSEDRQLLLDALGAVERPPGRLRLQIDPMRLR